MLYCQSVAPYPVKAKSKFALTHAVKLAEGGETLRDRGIGVWPQLLQFHGYSNRHTSLSILYPKLASRPRTSPYVGEYYPQGSLLSQSHPHSLMTLDKDLSSAHRPRIALGLDYVIQSPGQEVIPAIQDRIRELLSHKRFVRMTSQFPSRAHSSTTVTISNGEHFLPYVLFLQLTPPYPTL